MRKKTILKYFITLIYNNAPNIKNNILSINCCNGKGNIKFIREELKLFANSIIINKSQSNIKSVILLNADSLTIDATVIIAPLKIKFYYICFK